MKKIVLIFFLYSFFWTALTTSSNVLTSGFYYVDDHQIFTISDDLQGKGYFVTIETWIKKDLNSRFRPLYYFQRITQVYFYKHNFILYHLHNLILAIFTSIFLFLFAINFKINKYLSFIFPFLVLLGSQSAIWARLGPAETPGIFFLSISLWLISLTNRYKKTLLIEILSIFFLVLSTFCKESFILFVPAYIVILLWFNINFGFGKSSPKSILISKIVVILILTGILLIELITIKFIGTKNIQYAGFDGFKISYLKNVLFSIKKLFFDTNNDLRFDGTNTGFLIIISIIVILYLSKLNKVMYYSQNKIQLFYILVIASLILIPQFILYMKSGMYERYLIPASFGAALLAVFLINMLINFINNKVSQIILYLFIGLILLKSTAISYKIFKEFAVSSISFDKFIYTIKNKTIEVDSILFIANPISNFEWSYFMDYYFSSSQNHRQNINMMFLESNGLSNEGFANYLISLTTTRFNGRLAKINEIEKYKVIGMPYEIENQFLLFNKLNIDYQRIIFENKWIIYHKE